MCGGEGEGEGGREGRERRKRKEEEKVHKLYLEKMFLRACLKPEMTHFSFICFGFQKGRKVKASLF